ncbi:uncharacterized protein LOC136092895 isoform X2 [Hydra vulgaris]|uniref:uncharacterized protein LOC136092895 isoform X2 n=1 Tax=Hydra vulgaris TaxID=6087 RepID=UPI0032EA890F
MCRICIPSFLKDNKMNCIALRSEASGSCMYSSASLFFVADNTLMDVLRVLTSLEFKYMLIITVKHLSLIGGKNLADTIKNILLLLLTDTILSEYSMNCLKKKKKFKELTSLCYAVTDTIELIGKVIRHSSDRIKRTSTNTDFDQ